MDEELKAIVEIEKQLKGLKWEAKQRVLQFVQSRSVWDPEVDGGAIGLAQPQGSALNSVTRRD